MKNKQRKYNEGPTRVWLRVQEVDNGAWGKPKGYYLHVSVRGKLRQEFMTYGTELKYAVRDARAAMRFNRQNRKLVA
jgi:hypothetical protein